MRVPQEGSPLAFLREARAKQRQSKRLPPGRARHVREERLVDLGPERRVAQLRDGADRIDDRAGDLPPGQRQQLPERLPVQAREGKRNAARARHRDDAAPIAGEQLVQLDQLARDADDARGDDAARHEVHHGQEQEGLVRRAVAGRGIP